MSPSHYEIKDGKIAPKNAYERYQKVIKSLDERIERGEFDEVHRKFKGVRSRQVAALIYLLIEKEVIL